MRALPSRGRSSISALVDQMGHMERLKTLGIPYVYGIHLKQSVTLFLMALPFVLVEGGSRISTRSHMQDWLLTTSCGLLDSLELEDDTFFDNQ